METFEHYTNSIKKLLSQVYENRGVDFEQVTSACEKLIEEGQHEQDMRILGFAHYYLAENYYMMNDADAFLREIMTAMSLLEGTEQWELIARAYNFMAIMTKNRGNAPFAMDYYLTARSYCEKYMLTEVEVIVNINIAALYHDCGDKMTAQKYYEDSVSLLRRNPEIPGFDNYLMTAYFGLSNTALARGDSLTARDYLEKARDLTGEKLDLLDALCLHCMEARVYHAERKLQMRDEAIAEIEKLIVRDFPLLDVFWDLYEYAEMLLDAQKYDELWNTLQRLERLAGLSGIHYIQKRVLEMKIRHYKIHNDNAGFLQGAGLYFELSMLLEKENAAMVGKMLNVRTVLEESTKKQQEMKEESDAFKAKSETDALTGLSNRFRLHDEAAKCFRTAKQTGQYFGIEIMDIDYFKGFNDNYGHQAGDRCIKAVSEQIGSMQEHPRVFAARYGGDEFVLLYMGYNKTEMEEMMKELRDKIVAMAMPHAYSQAAPIVTLSQGGCCGIPRSGETVSEYLESADNMLYQIKEISRNSYRACEYRR